MHPSAVCSMFMGSLWCGILENLTWKESRTPTRCGLHTPCLGHDESSQLVTCFCSRFLQHTCLVRPEVPPKIDPVHFHGTKGTCAILSCLAPMFTRRSHEVHKGEVKLLLITREMTRAHPP